MRGRYPDMPEPYRLLTGCAQPAPAVRALFYAVAVFVSSLVGLLAMSTLARGEGERRPAVVNALVAAAVASTLAINLDFDPVVPGPRIIAPHRSPRPTDLRVHRGSGVSQEAGTVLHLRLIVPSDRTDEVTGLIAATVGATHLTVLKGAALDPPGDLVTCDVAREAADPLLAGLRRLGVEEHGLIAVDSVDMSLSRSSEEAERTAPGEGADAVLWDSMAELTEEESTLTVTYLAFLSVATMLAAYGVMLDSSILIVGAMVVGPEFGPLAGICTGLVLRRKRLVSRSAKALVIGFLVATLVTGAFGAILDLCGLFSRAQFESPHPATQFIWQPTADSFVVALLAGIAGVLSLTSAKSGALVGVAISVTTVPAAANAALALSYASWHEALGSTWQLVLNLAGIVVAGVATMLIQKWVWHIQHERAARTARG